MSTAKEDLSRVEPNDQFVQALELMERSDKNVFITGRAGDKCRYVIKCVKPSPNKSSLSVIPIQVL